MAFWKKKDQEDGIPKKHRRALEKLIRDVTEDIKRIDREIQETQAALDKGIAPLLNERTLNQLRRNRLLRIADLPISEQKKYKEFGGSQ